MVKRKELKLKEALNRHKGVDHVKEHQKKLRKQAEKLKREVKRQQQLYKNGSHDDDDDDEDIEHIIGDEEDSDAGVMLVTEADGTSHKEPIPKGDAEEADKDGEKDEDESSESEEERPFNMEALDDDSSICTSDEDAAADEKDEAEQGEGEGEGKDKAEGGEESEPGSEEEEDIPLSDLESLSSTEKGDLVPHQRLTINNHAALTAALNRISLPYAKLPFSAHQSVTSVTTTANAIEDPNDDLNRELQFYNQAQAAATLAREKLKKEGVPFSRPNDYFAEMVKSDEHMGRVKSRLVEEATAKKAAAEARKLRDAKKFGKKVQVEKEQERAEERREMKGKVESLKRKRQGAPITSEKEEDMFDIALENEVPRRQSGGMGRKAGGAPNPKRQKKDEKYGFGGKKRFAKSGDAQSSADIRGFSVKRMKSKEFGGSSKVKKPRPGKSKRQKGRA